MRKLPKVFNYFENHYSNNSSNLLVYQFLKFQSLFPGTVANMASGLYGAFPGEKKGYSIMKIPRK